jgi:hypothetical protein
MPKHVGGHQESFQVSYSSMYEMLSLQGTNITTTHGSTTTFENATLKTIYSYRSRADYTGPIHQLLGK